MSFYDDDPAAVELPTKEPTLDELRLDLLMEEAADLRNRLYQERQAHAASWRKAKEMEEKLRTVQAAVDILQCEVKRLKSQSLDPTQMASLLRSLPEAPTNLMAASNFATWAKDTFGGGAAIRTIKVLRDVWCLSLKEAKKVWDDAPFPPPRAGRDDFRTWEEYKAAAPPWRHTCPEQEGCEAEAPESLENEPTSSGPNSF